jgi:hypothetical protein
MFLIQVHSTRCLQGFRCQDGNTVSYYKMFPSLCAKLFPSPKFHITRCFQVLTRCITMSINVYQSMYYIIFQVDETLTSLLTKCLQGALQGNEY